MSKTIWRPRLQSGRPSYRLIVEALERDVAAGVIRQGERLPTVRALAGELEMAPLTISRAYREARRRGLVDAAVGRGTFVRSDAVAPDPALAERGLLDLSKNVIAGTETLDLEPRIVRDLRTVIRDADYNPTPGSPRHRMAGAAWIRRSGLDVPPDRVLVTPGAQQAIFSILAALCRPGDVIAAEALTYPRFASIAALLHLRVQPVEMDEHGMIPSSLEKALRKAKVLYCVPNLQNPTGSVLPEARRREIATLARKRSAMIIEDDVYGFLLDRLPPPITSFAPEHACLVTSVSKSLTPAMRIGFCAVPAALLGRLTDAFGAVTSFVSSTSNEIFTNIVESGAADRCLAAKRELVRRNRAAANRALPWPVGSHPMSPHLWLMLPKGTDPRDLAHRVRTRGIAVAPAQSFAVDGFEPPEAIRISIGTTTDTSALQTGLRAVAAVIAAPPIFPAVVV